MEVRRALRARGILDLTRPEALRNRWLSFVLASMLTACGGSVATSAPSASPAATPSPSPTAIQQSIVTADGQTRTYLLFRPSSLDLTQPAPLVLALHAWETDAGWMETTTHFDDQATKSGFVVVYPDGFDQSWNAGSCCGDAQAQKVGDIAFIRQLIDRLVSDGHIDPKRVFVTGFAAGAMMAHRLACELSGQIAAIASVAGALVSNTCKPTRPISVLEVHGTQDGVVPYAGGYSAHFSISFPSTLSVMKHWASLDGCAASPTAAQSGNSTTSTWGGCRQGATVVLDAVPDVFLWFGCDGCNPDDPNATAVVWDFFSHAPPLP